MHYVIDIQNDIRLSKFLLEFYTSDGQLMLNPQTSGKEMQFLNNVLQDQLEEEDQEYKQKIDEKVINWMRKSFANKNVDMKVKSEKEIICILLDIILY